MELIPNITVNDFRNENEKVHTLIRKIIKSLEEINDNSIFIYILFVKIWNNFDEFSNPFNNSKGIVKYDRLINLLDKVDENDFFNFFRKLEELPRDLFVRPSYFPIIDDKDDLQYKAGYKIKRTDFLKIIKSLRDISEISTKNSFENLINTYSNSEDIKLVEICKETIISKLKLLEYPKTDEIIHFKDTEFDENLYIY